MKLMFFCPKCCEEECNRTGDSRVSSEKAVVLVPLQEYGVYEFKCKNGHAMKCALQNPKYELLFEAAALATLDGYYREAIAGLSTALERVYEFASKVILRNGHGGDKLLENTWKIVASQSERQLGGFCLLYSLVFQQDPPILSNKYVEKRNKVIHRGSIPCYEEVVEFGDKVLSIIYQVLCKIKIEMNKAFSEHISYLMTPLRKEAKTVALLPMIISSFQPVEEFRVKSFQEGLENLERIRMKK
jgi:hypothetical protein